MALTAVLSAARWTEPVHNERKETGMHRRHRALLVTVPLLALALAGCARGGDTSDGVATAGGEQNAVPQANQVSADPEERGRQFAECMRGEGVDMPDPETQADGKRVLRVGGTDQEIDKDKLNAAMEKCRKYLPNGGEPRTPSPEELEKMRKFAQCMRDNGVPDFPDPDPAQGGFLMRKDGAGGAPKDDEATEAAMEKCNQYLPGKLTGGKTG